MLILRVRLFLLKLSLNKMTRKRLLSAERCYRKVMYICRMLFWEEMKQSQVRLVMQGISFSLLRKFKNMIIE
ncbi:hypothetical protein AB595_22355 [Massilia sp. WF1]|nr:hypothetical protein AB595_22355 [Massilia sp. WF1]